MAADPEQVIAEALERNGIRGGVTRRVPGRVFTDPFGSFILKALADHGYAVVPSENVLTAEELKIVEEWAEFTYRESAGYWGKEQESARAKIRRIEGRQKWLSGSG